MGDPLPHMKHHQAMGDSPVRMVLSGIIPQLVDDIVVYAAESAEELCRLASVCRRWRVASESKRIWKPLCQQRGYEFDIFWDTTDKVANRCPMYSRANWKALYVRIETIKAKMRKGDGVRKEPVGLRLLSADDHVRTIETSEPYLFIVCQDYNEMVLVYRKNTGEMINKLEAPHTGGIRDIRADMTGTTLVTNAYYDAAVRIWDVTSGVCTHTIYPQGSNPLLSTRVVPLYPFKNRVVLVENTLQGQGPRGHGDAALRAYDTVTAEVLQTSVSVEGLGHNSRDVVVDVNYILTTTRSHVNNTEIYALWDNHFLTCSCVIEEALRGERRRKFLLDKESTSIVSYTYCHQLPANANDRDSVSVWDFHGNLRLQMTTDAGGDRFYDVVISQRKLIILQPQYITVVCLVTYRTEHQVTLPHGQQLATVPILQKYTHDNSVHFAPYSLLVEAYLKRVGVEVHKMIDSIICLSTIENFVKDEGSPYLQCHTIDFNAPYP